MFLKAQLQWNVIIPPENLYANGLALQKAIKVRLLDEFAAKRATSTLGYFLAVTTLDKVGEGRVRQHSGDVVFPVTFTCITYKAFAGEILEGEVHKIMKHGVFLRCGPVEHIFLPSDWMQGYSFVPGENPIFMSEKSAKIEKGVKLRVMVIKVSYMEAEKEFQAVANLDGDFLGPV
ncbi:DNA-directed RNA polymerase V subunit 7 [Heracleum sosnowskyi]|uniref:DNA-directed RNA polymerase subunit n=1 Tax=Heracleum sosnowskyi TaxID=360622 RepID=A0AAD8I8H6_9APIA|nr:DNA-directed RNA polymerase V subunit 7 [Heracleum sosnowskyi]